MAIGTKIAIASLATGGVGTTGFFIVKNIRQNSSNSIASKINDKYLLKANDTEQWKERVATLKLEKDVGITPELKVLKDKGEALKEKDLQGWCDSSLKSKFKSKESLEFKNTLTYCLYNLGDKVSGTKIVSSTADGDNKLGAIWTSIKGINQNTQISEGLKGVKNTANGDTGNSGNIAVRNWCLGQYKIPYYENESDLRESQNYCILK